MNKVLDFLGQQNSFELISHEGYLFSQRVEKLYSYLLRYIAEFEKYPAIVLAEREPVQFLATFTAACAANCPVFLCNPDWGTQEWYQVFHLIQPDIICGTPSSPLLPPLPPSPPPFFPHSQLPIPHSPKIMIPTGGSSGKIKFAVHTWDTLMASVYGFTQYFQLQEVNSFCVLPLYHVSGLMQFMRSFTTGGKLVVIPFKELLTGDKENIKPEDFFISLVPTQLQGLLQNCDSINWLRKFKTVLLGGAPAWEELFEKVRYYEIRLAPTYGMTETASQIATLKPDDFLKGKANSGQVLPHAQVIIRNDAGEIINANQIGNITIKANSLTLGYYKDTHEKTQEEDYLQVDDLGFIDTEGYLNIVGRNSDKIITGGENVYPIEVEAAIRTTEMVKDVCVIGIPDKYWGQAVTAIYIPQYIAQNFCTVEIEKLLKNKLSKFKIPKHWIPMENLPRNSQGKINRQQLQEIATNFLEINLV
ncbi:MAG: 2-succinylbenzoate--CoA ligase [Scytonematopsis contorta HA4267-MV1]|jgi:O-succinylbenzoic acid--CoA ligase|nr:2-succinylbenzoate--CoA ligase [Scytonematopsis contorta HA4267-MV1]